MLLISLAHQNKGLKPISLEEALGVLMSGFLRGGVGFLKGTGEMIKGSSGVNREVRVGVTHVSTDYKCIIFCQQGSSCWCHTCKYRLQMHYFLQEQLQEIYRFLLKEMESFLKIVFYI
jgi:hypothetical protein